MPTWSILIATICTRHEKLLRLLGVLLPQAEKFPGQVEVVALHNCAERSIGEYRQALLDGARGRYVSFFDDDDLPEPDFVKLVLEAMAKQPEGKPPDYIAFHHAYYEDGVRDPRTVITGINFGGWSNTPLVFIRNVTHVNPVRTELALKAGFRNMGKGEDADYDNRLVPLLHTQEVINQVLYHYYHSMSDSMQISRPPWIVLRRNARRPEVHSSAFRWHPWSTG